MRKESCLEIGDDICSCFWHWSSGRVRLALSSVSPLDLGTIQLDRNKAHRAELTAGLNMPGIYFQPLTLKITAQHCWWGPEPAFLTHGSSIHLTCSEILEGTSHSVPFQPSACLGWGTTKQKYIKTRNCRVPLSSRGLLKPMNYL